VVPVGRHSLMNGVSLPLRDYDDEIVFTAFADQLGAFLEQSMEYGRRAQKVVLANLALLGYVPGRDVLLDDYLGAARRSRKVTSKSAFRSLLASLLPPGPPEQTRATLDALVGVIEAVAPFFRRGLAPSKREVKRTRRLWSDALAGAGQ
jgi:hypothetical protein